jgi:hypothetical protein
MGDLRRLDILPYLVKHNPSAFVETGTGHGNGVDKAFTLGFEKIYSTEIIEEQFEKLKPKYENIPNIFLYNLPSPQFLKEVLPKIQGNIFFWLDAHYPGADLHMSNCKYLPNVDCWNYDPGIPEEFRLPLLTELLIIKELRKDKKDIIFIDDLAIFLDDNIRPEFKPKGDYNKNFIVNFFGDTHNIEILEVGHNDNLGPGVKELIGVLTPKI